VGLVRRKTNTIKLGLALAVFMWTVLVALAFVGGVADQLFSLSLIGAHVRLLAVVPLFFLCETAFDPRLTELVRSLVQSGVVPKSEVSALESEITRTNRWNDSWLPEAMCLVAAALLSFLASHLHLYGATAALTPSRAVSEVTLAGQWYWIVCLTVFRFLLFRWFWRLCLWSFFLWRMSRLQLHLVPTHPDGVAGLEYLEVVHTQFAPLALAISVLESASFAEEISAGTMTFESMFPGLAIILIVDASLFLAPLCIFAPKLWACRLKGLRDYMELAAHYVSDFDKKWLGADALPAEPLLGTPDLQSLADLSNSVNIVRNMRIAPIGLRLLANLAIAALLPLLPLLLFKYPAFELAEKFLKKLCDL
jgi:hypothetical protein